MLVPASWVQYTTAGAAPWVRCHANNGAPPRSRGRAARINHNMLPADALTANDTARALERTPSDMLEVSSVAKQSAAGSIKTTPPTAATVHTRKCGFNFVFVHVPRFHSLTTRGTSTALVHGLIRHAPRLPRSVFRRQLSRIRIKRIPTNGVLVRNSLLTP